MLLLFLFCRRVVRRVNSPNFGRWFYNCPLDDFDKQCSYFEWEDEIQDKLECLHEMAESARMEDEMEREHLQEMDSAEMEDEMERARMEDEMEDEMEGGRMEDEMEREYLESAGMEDEMERARMEDEMEREYLQEMESARMEDEMEREHLQEMESAKTGGMFRFQKWMIIDHL